MIIPAIFSVDLVTNESLGSRPFCTQLCIAAAGPAVAADIRGRGFIPLIARDEANNHCEGAACTGCGNPLEAPAPPPG